MKVTLNLLLLIPAVLSYQTRRLFLGSSVLLLDTQVAFAAEKPSLDFATSTSGLQWADAKVGTGPIPQPNSYISIDYVLSTTGARYGSKIYSTTDQGGPYRWKLGDKSTIAGVELAILGTADIPPMRPGGIRRVIIPPDLAYQALAVDTSCKGIGPVPPKDLNNDSFEAFQRFKNIYCNPNRVYQPNVVMDIKLYGKRSLD